MTRFLVLIVFISTVFSSVFSVRRINRQCKSSQVCVDIYQCPFYVNLRTKQLLPSSTVQSVRKKFCGVIDRNTPKVCCDVNDDESARSVLDHKNLNLLPMMEACGHVTTNKRITEGVNVAVSEFPWMALLAYKTDSLDDEEFKCAGTLINHRYILTAAHCVDGDQSSVLGVRLGEHDIFTEIDCDKNGNNCGSPIQDILIEKVTVHPDYDPVKLINDIALVRLASPANTSAENVKPVCLPLAENLQEINLNGRFLMVTGWGVTETGLKSKVLRKTSVPVLSLKRCSGLYNRFRPISSKQLCAGGYKGRDSCAGDSGGPLQTVEWVDKAARYVQYGIVSYGPSMCGLDGRPAIYTNVAEYLHWILDNIF